MQSHSYNRIIAIRQLQSDNYNPTITIRHLQSENYNRTIAIGQLLQSYSYNRTITIVQLSPDNYNRMQWWTDIYNRRMTTMMTRTSSLVPWPNIKKYGNMEIYDDDDFFWWRWWWRFLLIRESYSVICEDINIFTMIGEDCFAYSREIYSQIGASRYYRRGIIYHYSPRLRWVSVLT